MAELLPFEWHRPWSYWPSSWLLRVVLPAGGRRRCCRRRSGRSSGGEARLPDRRAAGCSGKLGHRLAANRYAPRARLAVSENPAKKHRVSRALIAWLARCFWHNAQRPENQCGSAFFYRSCSKVIHCFKSEFMRGLYSFVSFAQLPGGRGWKGLRSTGSRYFR